MIVVKSPTEFENSLSQLDLDLFNHIHSESRSGDKRSWLALQAAVRSSAPSYCYLEIGSHLGGSIQPHLLDSKCRRIYSVDKRPIEPPDNRGIRIRYEGNSTSRMIENLSAIDRTQIGKIKCFDSDAKDIDTNLITDPPDFCFIDGEHTNTAALSDFEFCFRVCAPNAIISFHDDRIIAPALSRIIRKLSDDAIPFRAFKLEGSTFAIALRSSSALRQHTVLGPMITDGVWALRYLQMRFVLKGVTPPFLMPVFSRLFGIHD
jgi:hypothetical protein